MAALTGPQLLQGMFGNYASLLGGAALPSNVMSLLSPTPPSMTPMASAIGGAGTMPTAQPTPTLSPMERATQIGDLLNKNAYGTSDPTHLGILGSAGFPLFSDPRMIHSYLGTMAMNGDDDALAQLRRMLQGGWSWGGYGMDSGMGGMGGNIGGGQGPGGAHASGTTGIDAGLAAELAAADAASGAATGGDVAGAASDVNAGLGGLY